MLVKQLLSIMAGDERRENRLKAIYVLGKLGFYLGNEAGHEAISMAAFRELAAKLIQLQHAQRSGTVSLSDVRDSKVFLLHALGKFARVAANASASAADSASGANSASAITSRNNSKYMDSVLVHVCREDLELNPNDLGLAKGVLRLLNSEIAPDSRNRPVVGTIFQQHVNRLMRSASTDVQMEAVQFAR